MPKAPPPEQWKKDAKALAGGCGCLLVAVVGVLIMCNRSCGAGSREELHAEAMERTRAHNLTQDLAAQESARKAREKADSEERNRKAIEEGRALILARLESLKPPERVKQLRECSKSAFMCPDAERPDLIFETAATPTERKQLEALWKQLEAEKEQAEKRRQRTEKAERRADAPLKCCDGSLSPTCTCGSPGRGCCSRHGGVCGCSE
jgi:hypothetical protein